MFSHSGQRAMTQQAFSCVTMGLSVTKKYKYQYKFRDSSLTRGRWSEVIVNL